MKKEKQNNHNTLVGLISIIMFLLIGSILCIFLMSTSEKSYTAYIYQDGILVDTVDLSAVTQSYELIYQTREGGYNTVTIHPQEIAVTEASCPDHICVHQGFIRNSLLPITCLPNKLVIQLKENAPVITPDIITY